MSHDDAPDTTLTESVDWEDRTSGRVKRFLLSLERFTLRAERPVEVVVGKAQFNPLHHTGPISVFLFVVVFATGLYLTMFYRFGFEASYESVSDLEASLAGRFVRAAHRYGSIALVVTTVLHGWRTFVMDRFRGPRRVAWLTGVAMVGLIWIIGVTGYWLIWDERVEVLNEVLIRALRDSATGLDFLLDFVLTDAAGTGWPVLLLLFFLHVGISIGVAVLIWVHVKRLARPMWLPPGFWVAVVGVSLIIMSAVWPVGMLPALDRVSLPASIPVDPFFLFLVPGGISWNPAVLWGGALLLMAGAMFLPWFIRRMEAPVIQVDADRCTGCRLCVTDCPYDALHMIDLEDAAHPHLAVVTAGKCVGCGICIGSCPVEALAFRGHPADALWNETRRAAADGDVTFVCERHDAHAAAPPGAGAVLAVPCVGMVHPDLIGAAIDAGAAAVQVVGCPPGDCANREGPATLAARLNRKRRPRLLRRYREAPIFTDWVNPTRLSTALAAPGRASDADLAPRAATASVRPGLPLFGLVAVTAIVTVLVTGLRFDPGGNDDARLEITLDHRAGVPLVGFAPFEAAPSGAGPRLLVEADGRVLYDRTVPVVRADEPDTALLLERFSLAPGVHSVRVTLFDVPDQPMVLFDDTIGIEAGEAVVLYYRDVSLVDPAEAGRAIFNETALGTNAGCRICHSLDPGRDLVGPSLAGVGTRAANTVDGLSGADYLRQAIVDPDAYVVPGYPAGQMLAGLGEVLSPGDLDSLIAFLLTLEESP
ncbi:MAG: 4Fe-4S dicluster domain-containing protein [Acidimicrobiia bacterium]|nr:4Fe-4S dicluster domain-containing protein [Acidimicrobiia bacterium]